MMERNKKKKTTKKDDEKKTKQHTNKTNMKEMKMKTT